MKNKNVEHEDNIIKSEGKKIQLLETGVETPEGKRVLLVSAEKFTDRMSWWQELLYGMVSLLLVYAAGISLGIWNIVILITMEIFLLPFLADYIVKRQISLFLENDRNKALEECKGNKTFSLYTKRYEVSWKAYLEENSEQS